MIKVIASDMDGTLLNDDHQLDERTAEAIRLACREGIRFIITTGRNFYQAMEQLQGHELNCDYILASGAEVRNADRQIVSRIAMDYGLCKEVQRELRKWPVSVIFSTDAYDYRLGTAQMVEESIRQQLKVFHLNMEEEELLKMPVYDRIRKRTRAIADFDELEREKIRIYKIFLFSDNIQMLQEIDKALSGNDRIAAAASFETNLEITDVRAQKGPVLKTYIESLGCRMEEVMALGDSMNDYSMLSMDFGATVAVANAMPQILDTAKYITKSNQELGVAWAIEHRNSLDTDLIKNRH